MKRTNTFIVEDNPPLKDLADNCARLYNELNFERRQAYIHYKKFSWYPRHLYRRYAPLVGSATAQQIIRKNNEAWRSFLKLKKLEKKGKLPPHVGDWWYWTRRITREQSRLARVNKARVSRKLKKFYRIRQRRFRHAVNAMIKWMVELF